MGEKYFAQLEEVEHEEVEGSSGAALDRFVVLLNWTFLSVSSGHTGNILVPSSL